ncbi:MAG: hypothetical protein JKY95_04850 [Planctomycetaceae bacterium]|nr:hypothetical protein [Planctomycetaceae bacterium]
MSFCKCFLLMVATCIFPAVVAVVSSDSLQAASGTKFPYRAAIVSEKVDVLSGPGSRYYATSSLTKDAEIIVHRHDPGGWYMITPPQGSFSLVRADYIEKQNANHGVVTQNHVVVWVASALNKHREVEQRRLMKGDKVRIISEDRVSDRGRIHTVYRIEPPQHEYRWVKGDDVIPLDAAMRRSHDLDPFAVPSNGIEIDKAPARQNTPDLKYPIASGKDKKLASGNSKRSDRTTIPLNRSTGSVETGPSQDEVQRDRNILIALDRNFRDMIQKDVPQWNITDLAHDYRKLQQATPVTAIASQIDLRLNAMERYRKMKAEYDDLIKLTSATDRRNAQLISLQEKSKVAAAQPLFPESTFQNEHGEIVESYTEGETGFLPDLGPAPWDGEQLTENSVDRQWRKIASGNDPFTPAPSPASVSSGDSHDHHAPHQQASKRFSGAGIVKKVRNSNQVSPAQAYPQFALVSPTGKLLAYLEPGRGVDLNRFLGHSIGVYGHRHNDTALHSDVISVTGLLPVRLAPR